MFLASLLLLYAYSSTSSAAPVPLLEHHDCVGARALGDGILDGIMFNRNYRSTADIVRACCITIFLCTWVSVHPNVRGYRSTWGERTLMRIELMFWALMMPELMVIWAFRQWHGARAIHEVVMKRIEAVKDRVLPDTELAKWTMIHSHFLQMGGYRFRDNRDVLEWVDTSATPNNRPWWEGENLEIVGRAMEALVRRPETQDEISDRSKSDALAKVITVLQTTWFIIQCIARHNQRLAITELEIITLAYAVLNGMMYAFWWNKPFNVQCPIIVQLPPQGVVDSKDSNGSASKDSHSPASEDSNSPDPATPWYRRIHGHMKRCVASMGAAILHLAIWPRQLYQSLSEACEGLSFGVVFEIVISSGLIILSIPIHFLRRLRGIAFTDQNQPCSAKDQFPTFHTHEPSTDSRQFHFSVNVGPMIAAIFGAIHCAAWSFPFPYPASQLLWRITSLFICISPLTISLAAMLNIVLDGLAGAPNSLRYLSTSLFIISLPSMVLYIPARIILLVLSCIELAHLPPSAHQTVKWTNFLPHA